MLYRLASEASAREVWWIHTTHDADSHAFATEVTDLLGRLPSAHSLVYYTTPAEPLAPDSGMRTGRLTAEVIADLGLPTDASAYVCGPEPFMDDVAAALAGVGIDPARIHTERFGSRSPINPGVVAADAPAATPAARPAGRRTGGDLRPLGTHDCVVGHVRVGARARRGVRRADAVVVPHRRLPHLRHGGAVRRGVVRRRRRSSHPATTSCSSARPSRPRPRARPLRTSSAAIRAGLSAGRRRCRSSDVRALPGSPL